MQDAMVDLETLGTATNSVILSIGVCMFDRDEQNVGNSFSAVVDINSCQRVGLTVDGGTVYWWFKQQWEARRRVGTGMRALKPCLQDLSTFLAYQDWTGRVWSHGATFDIPILDNAYRASGLDTPWKYTKARDTRTVFDLADHTTEKMLSREGTHHDALDDAIFQAREVQRAIFKIRNGRYPEEK